MLVSLLQLKKESNQFVEETLTKKEIKAEEVILKPLTTGNILSQEENMEKRKAMIASTSIEPGDFAFERTIGKNDSLYSNFTELIALTKSKVGRIVIIENAQFLNISVRPYSF
jgi:endonuclease G, mitochondrial